MASLVSGSTSTNLSFRFQIFSLLKCIVLFDFTLPQSISRGPAYTYEEHGKNNLHSSILVIKYLLSKISNNRAEELEKELEAFFGEHKENPATRSIIENKIGFVYK